MHEKREHRDRYVLLCQQALVFAAVLAVVAPAARMLSLDIVPPAGSGAQQNAQNADGASGDASDRTGTVDPAEQGAVVASAPVAPTVRSVPITGVDVASKRALDRVSQRQAERSNQRAGGQGLALAGATMEELPSGQAGELSGLTKPESVAGFATVGVSWKHGEQVAEKDIVVSIRTKTNGAWGPWQELEYHDDHAPDPGSEEAKRARPGTDPMVVGEVDDIQVKAVTADGTLPADMKLALVDPGETPDPTYEAPAIDTAYPASYSASRPANTEADDAAPLTDPEADDTAVPVAANGTTPKPKIFSRAQWGANEKMRDKGSLRYGEVHAAFVHHTVNANNYSKADVPAILRGIYAYHVNGRGWSDIGYNFLVDRFGRIWEGRFGGVARPGVGAHTLGFNDYATAMSAIGNFETVKPSAAMLDAYARLWAWKLSLHGIKADSTKQWVGSRYFPAINGHRDAAKTACPGRYLYAKLGEIRTKAAEYQRSFDSRNLAMNISGSKWPDIAARDKVSKRLVVIRTGGQVRYAPAVKIGNGFAGADLVVPIGDVTGDGRPDVLARAKSTGITSLQASNASGKFGKFGANNVVRTTTAFAGLDQLTAVGDFDGDGKADLVGRVAATKRLVLYKGKGAGKFAAPVTLADTWNFNLTAGVGDFNGDGQADLVARGNAGKLFLFSGNKSNKPSELVGARKLLGTGFNAYDLIAGHGDITGDGRPDILVRQASGKLTKIYTGDGKGGLGDAYGPFKRFGGVDWIAGGGNYAGTKASDVIGRNGKGNLVVFPRLPGKNLGDVVTTNVSLADMNLVRNVGDWNHDGFGDVIARDKAGQLLLYFGKGGKKFSAPVVAATGWSNMKQVISVGDVTGDGHNDLMARAGKGGAYMIYPGDGNSKVKAGYLAHSPLTSIRQVPMGLWDGDGAPDTLLFTSDGKALLYPGNGPGGMTSGKQIASGIKGYNWVLGLGDLDGNGRSDLLVRDKAGVLWILPGTKSGFADKQFIASGFSGYDLAAAG